MTAATPVTIVTGFLGSGKTTLILNLIPQLPKSYKLALLKNEFGDVAVDSQLAASSSISGVTELLGGCVCCNLVGQLGDALETLRCDVVPDRIIIETSGSAFPATLAMEVNRLDHFALDGVIVVIDVENWKGYEDTSYTAKMQAKFTDLMVFNKWESVDERRYEDCLDKVGDLEVQVAIVKSDKGKVDKALLLGLDTGMASVDESALIAVEGIATPVHDHQSEVEVLSVTLKSLTQGSSIDLEALDTLLRSASRDEIYRIKAVLYTSELPISSDSPVKARINGQRHKVAAKYILNWAFARWTFTLVPEEAQNCDPVLRMTIILARDEATKWKTKVESGHYIMTQDEKEDTSLVVQRLT